MRKFGREVEIEEDESQIMRRMRESEEAFSRKKKEENLES